MIASVLLAVTWPAATFVIWRSALGAPTLTTPTGALPANVPSVVEPTVALLVGTAAAVTEFAPSATEFAVAAVAPVPIATASAPVATLSGPVEFAWKYLMPFALMLSIAEPTLVLAVVVPFALYVVYDGAEIVPVAGLYVAPPPSAAAVLLPRLLVVVATVDRPVESEPMPVDVEVDSEAIELVAELRPVEVDVDSEATVLFAVDSPVDNELTPLCAVLMPDEAEV
ncbi:hypothetical protein ACGYTX_31765, partial [Burkholderia pseudomallei]